jgi:hypothetical protein
VSIGIAVDVAIGLIFLYLLLGMLASAVQEFVAGVMKLRGRQLRDSLQNMLAGVTAGGRPSDGLFHNVFGHALVQGGGTANLPSYVSGRNFSLALLDTLTDGTQAPLFSQVEKSVAALPDGPAKDSLSAILGRTGGDLDKLEAGVQAWFDDAMDRVSGIYKRFSQYFNLAFGLVLAVGLNINSIDIAKTLSTDDMSRNAIVEMATKEVAKPQATSNLPPTADSVAVQAGKLRDDLGSLLPIGWPSGKNVFVAIWEKLTGKSGEAVVAVIGWLITAFAVSLGAPFWFDMLQNVINLRNAGPKPAPSQKQD